MLELPFCPCRLKEKKKVGNKIKYLKTYLKPSREREKVILYKLPGIIVLLFLVPDLNLDTIGQNSDS
jgi:hypothetical protein